MYVSLKNYLKLRGILLNKNLKTLQTVLRGDQLFKYPKFPETQKTSEGSDKEELRRISLCGLEKRKDEIASGN